MANYFCKAFNTIEEKLGRLYLNMVNVASPMMPTWTHVDFGAGLALDQTRKPWTVFSWIPTPRVRGADGSGPLGPRFSTVLDGGAPQDGGDPDTKRSRAKIPDVYSVRDFCMGEGGVEQEVQPNLDQSSDWRRVGHTL